MTTVNQDTGRIIWSLESKLFLLKLIKENVIILSSDVSADTMAQKELAWKIIETSFAEDGMRCQLDKIKRLWKRMKESTRHTVKQINLQKRRRVKNVKELSQLDNEILKFITINEDEVPARKAKQKPKARKYVRTKAAKKEINDEFEYEQHNYYNNTENQTIHDSYFEPVTILEEYDQKPSTEIISENIIDPFTINDNINGDSTYEHNDYENYINELNITNINYKNKAQQQKTTTTTTTTTTTNLANDCKQMESELLLADLKYKQSLRDNEVERMEYDRELYRKKIILLDLQIKKTNLELSRLV